MLCDSSCRCWRWSRIVLALPFGNRASTPSVFRIDEDARIERVRASTPTWSLRCLSARLLRSPSNARACATASKQLSTSHSPFYMSHVYHGGHLPLDDGQRNGIAIQGSGAKVLAKIFDHSDVMGLFGMSNPNAPAAGACDGGACDVSGAPSCPPQATPKTTEMQQQIQRSALRIAIISWCRRQR
jgi:hypothetical protein